LSQYGVTKGPLGYIPSISAFENCKKSVLGIFEAIIALQLKIFRPKIAWFSDPAGEK
jgi:hypothetical protein